MGKVQGAGPWGRELWGRRGCEDSGDVGKELPENGSAVGASPGAQVGRLDVAETEGRPHVIEQHRDEDAPSLADLGLFMHPFGGDRVRGPDDDHRAAIVQLGTNDLSPGLTRGNCPVPEDRPARPLQGVDEGQDPVAVLTRVADEDVTHQGVAAEGRPAGRDPAGSSLIPGFAKPQSAARMAGAGRSSDAHCRK